MKEEYLRSMIQDMISGNFPNAKTNAWNRFSLSKLAFSVDSQYNWKINPTQTITSVSEALMFAGRAKHEFIQNRFAESGFWQDELFLEYTLPYHWVRHPELSETLTLAGKIDLYNPDWHSILEIKTGAGEIKEYEIMQAAAYKEIYQIQQKRSIEAWIIKVDGEIHLRMITDSESAHLFKEICDRAYSCANKLNKVI